MKSLSRSLLVLVASLWAAACHSTETTTDMDAAVDRAADLGAPEDRAPLLNDLSRDLGRPEVSVDVAVFDASVPTPRRCPFEASEADAGVDVVVTGPRPRLVGPLSTTRVTTQRPSLRYELPEGLTRPRLELCEDPRCGRVFLTIPLPETTGLGRVRPEHVLRPGVVFWRMIADSRDGSGERVSFTWEFGVGHRDTPLDSSHGTISDFEGDGFDDVAIADSMTNGGVIYAYSGSSAGLRTTPSATLLSPIEQVGGFGTIKAVGDVDRDGRADLVTTNGLYGAEDGAEVFRGCREGLAEVPSQELLEGIFEGPSHFLASLGDINGDGFSDFAKWGFRDRRGFTSVLLGSPSGLRVSWLSDASYCAGCLTDGITGLGDVNGDGYGDILWTAYSSTEYQIGVVLGRPEGPNNHADFTIEPVPRMLGAFGGEALGVGDLNDDGMAEFIIRDIPYTYLYRGARDLTGAHPIADVNPPGRADVAGLYLGVPIPGDVDGDGVVDVVFPAPNAAHANTDAGTFPGTVYQFHLTASGGFADKRIIWGTSTSRAFGDSVTVQGDVNGDGFSDLVVSAYHLDEVTHQRIDIFLGGLEGLPDSYNQSLPLYIGGIMYPYIIPM